MRTRFINNIDIYIKLINSMTELISGIYLAFFYLTPLILFELKIFIFKFSYYDKNYYITFCIIYLQIIIKLNIIQISMRILKHS